MASDLASHEDMQATIMSLNTENQRLRQHIAHLEEQIRPEPVPDNASATVLYQQLFEDAPVSLSIFYPDGRLVTLNRQAEVLLGLSREAIEAPYNLLQDPDAGKRGLAACFRRTLQMQEPGVITTMVDRAQPAAPDQPPATPRWEEHTYFPITTQDGLCRYVGQISRDVTEPIQREAMQQQNQSLLQGMIDHIPAVIYSKTLDGRFLLANQSLARSMGMAADQLIGTYDSDYLPPDVIENWRALTNQVLESGAPIQREEPFLQDDGLHTYLSVQFPLFDETGNMYAIGGMATDISERKQIETDLHQSRSMLQGILDHTPMGIFAKDAQGTFVMMNRTAAALMHMDVDEAVGKRDSDFYPDAYVAPWREQDAAILRSRKPIFLEEETPIDDELRNFMTVKFPIYGHHEIPAAVGTIIMDITERKQAERERAALQQQIIDAQRDTLRELSTPLIPISDRVVILPLIGTIDTGRAQMVMETLLEGVARYQADLVIVDITGVSVVDTQVAQALVQAAQAARLLGAQVMLTGIQPQIAQTLVHLGVDLSGMQTRSSLQAGIAMALAWR